MHIFFTLLYIVLAPLFLEWHARGVFIARAYRRRYGHGKSWKRAHKHYKTNWTFIERMLWVHAFKEKYEDKYRIIAYLSYIHTAFMIVMAVSFLVLEHLFPLENAWLGIFIAYFVFWVIRFIYDNAIARGEI